jgi:hypothetical protein
MRQLLASVLLLAAGCATEAPEPTPPDVFFPRHGSPLGAGDAALLEGLPEYADGCLWVVAPNGARYLPIWPADTELGMLNSQPAVFGPERMLIYEVGDAFADTVGLGGSETSAETARELVGEIPERCAADGFWVVSDVLNRP